jgi:hypothetical protein
MNVEGAVMLIRVADEAERGTVFRSIPRQASQRQVLSPQPRLRAAPFWSARPIADRELQMMVALVFLRNLSIAVSFVGGVLFHTLSARYDDLASLLLLRFH